MQSEIGKLVRDAGRAGRDYKGQDVAAAAAEYAADRSEDALTRRRLSDAFEFGASRRV